MLFLVFSSVPMQSRQIFRKDLKKFGLIFFSKKKLKEFPRSCGIILEIPCLKHGISCLKNPDTFQFSIKIFCFDFLKKD